MHTRVVIIRSAGLMLLAALAACTGGSPGSPSLGAASPQPVEGASVVTPVIGSPSAPTATLPPTASPAAGAPSPGASGPAAFPAGPPTASLTGLAAGPMAGDLGTAAWDGIVSDAPWIVGPAEGRAPPGSRLTVVFDPALQPTWWRARWAPVQGREAGTPRSGGSGSSEPIVVAAPEQAGTWSLQVEATFGPDASGAWYWRVRVGR